MPTPGLSLLPFADAAVARPVSKKEAESNPKAQAAMQAEWDRLKDINTWDEDGVEECVDDGSSDGHGEG